MGSTTPRFYRGLCKTTQNPPLKISKRDLSLANRCEIFERHRKGLNLDPHKILDPLDFSKCPKNPKIQAAGLLPRIGTPEKPIRLNFN